MANSTKPRKPTRAAVKPSALPDHQTINKTTPLSDPNGSPTSNVALKQQADTARQNTRIQVQARREAQVRVARAARIRHRVLLGTVVAIVVIAMGAGLSYWNNYSHPGEYHLDMAMQVRHIATVDTVHPPYSTNPPTSGPHTQELAPWGVSDTVLHEENVVHNLEDAGVVVNYRPDLPADAVARLKALVESYGSVEVTLRNTPPGSTSQTVTGRVLMAPYPNLSDPIVFTAWNRLQRFQSYDESTMRHFIDMYRGIDHHQGDNAAQGSTP